MKNSLLAVVCILAACASNTPPASAVHAPLQTEDQKSVYALGVFMGQRFNLAGLGLTAEETDIAMRGVKAAALEETPEVDMNVYGPKLQKFASDRATARAPIEKEKAAKRAAAEKAKAKPFLEQAAKEPGAEKLPSGLIYRTLKPGTGPSPKLTDRVKVHYHGTMIDGTVFDSSVKRGQPADFTLGSVIRCWQEGVARMKVGEKAKLVCPAELAYGDQQKGQIPPGATLIFEVELLGILPPQPPHPGFPMPGMHGMPPAAMRPDAGVK